MPRTRRTAEATRDALLDAAQALLVARGPDAITLDAVGAAIGVSRQAVLHHFGSRAGVLRAVVERSWKGLFADLATLSRTEGRSADTFVDRVDDVARRRGNARLGAWLLLSGEGLPDEVFEGALQGLPTDRDAAFELLLIGSALFGDAIFGTRLRQALGLAEGEDEREEFRRWLVKRLKSSPAAPPR